MKLLAALLFTILPTSLSAASLTFMGTYIWSAPLSGFGGFSALELGPNGRKLTTVSDKGRILGGTLQRREGRITGVKIRFFTKLREPDGKPLGKYDTDSEGLAIDSRGRAYISFEGNHRVWRYEGPSSAANGTGRHKDFRHFQVNSGLEALAIDASGTLYTLPERSGDINRPFPVYRKPPGGKWRRAFTLPRRGRFLPTGADFGPDGKLYLLERDFIWSRGFASRIRRFDVTAGGLKNEETLLVTPFGKYDNLEGIALWKDRQGRIRLTMISDDNFNFFQTTEFVEYALSSDKPDNTN
ncbi:MAG: esterase-like activity of phytase family protein [Paracoccaceae bacterium]|nr:esterase-like activity of phytase family protein [Paracoccaceae bacterium]